MNKTGKHTPYEGSIVPKAPHLYPRPKQFRCEICGAKNPTKTCFAIGHHEAHPEIASIYLREAA